MNKIISQPDETELPDLGINPDKVCHVILKARQFDVKEAPADENSGSNPADDGMIDVLEDTPDDPTYRELTAFIRSLDEEEQIWLVALAWIGRGTYEPRECKEALKEARDQHNKRTAEYLTGLPLLGDYLEEGLASFGEDCQAFEAGRL
jgi:hypothetical protein